MYGKATLELPATGNIGPARTEGLSDEMAISYGTLFARTLSDNDGFAIVTLSDGARRVIGLDEVTNEILIGRLGKGQ